LPIRSAADRTWNGAEEQGLDDGREEYRARLIGEQDIFAEDQVGVGGIWVLDDVHHPLRAVVDPAVGAKSNTPSTKRPTWSRPIGIGLTVKNETVCHAPVLVNVKADTVVAKRSISTFPI
jgi:hypothetical protein